MTITIKQYCDNVQARKSRNFFPQNFPIPLMQQFIERVGDALAVADAAKASLFYGNMGKWDPYSLDAINRAVESVPVNVTNFGYPNLDQAEHDMLHAWLGLLSETVELGDQIFKKFNDHSDMSAEELAAHNAATGFDETNYKEELGDILWFLTLAAGAVGVDLQELMESNDRKLEARHGSVYNQDATRDENRDRAAEAAAVEGDAAA